MNGDHMLGLFVDGDERLQRWLSLGQDLDELAGTQPHRLPGELDETVSGTVVPLFDTPITGTARVQAAASLEPAGRRFDVFGTGVLDRLRDDKLVALLDVRASLGLGARASSPRSWSTLSIDGSASREIRYRRYLPVQPHHRRATAYANLVRESRLPHRLDVSQRLAIGEVHRLDAKMNLDVGLEAAAGLDAGHRLVREITVELTDGLAAPFVAQVTASVKASLGLAMSSRMMLVVARADLTGESTWTRIRLQRERERRLSFGLTMALDLHYDLGTGLVQLLEEALDAVPTPRLVRGARAVLASACRAERGGLGAETREVLQDLLLHGIIDDDDEVVSFAAQVVEFYGSLDGELQSLWDRVLSKMTLVENDPRREKAIVLLDRLLALGDGVAAAQLASMGNTSASWTDLVPIIEAITGESVDDLVLDGRLDQALARVSETAAEAKRLLSTTPSNVLAKMQAFARHTGLESTVASLRELKTLAADIDSAPAKPQQLDEASVSLRLRRLVERLTGSLWHSMDAEDLRRVSRWAAKLDDYLSWADLDDAESRASVLTRRMTDYLERAKAHYGLSLAFEIERTARSSALVDIEIDPQAPRELLALVSDALRSGRLKQLIASLLDAQGDDDDRDRDLGDAPFFRIRECVFTSERIRGSALSGVFNLIGLGRKHGGAHRSFNRRITQSSLRIEPRPEGYERLARYGAGYVRGDEGAGKSYIAGTWLVAHESGSGADIRKDFDGERRGYLRLVINLEDVRAGEQELEGLDRLLADLGLLAESESHGAEVDRSRRPSELVSAGSPAQLSLELRLPLALDGPPGDDVLSQLLSDGASKRGVPGTMRNGTVRNAWDLAFLNAAYRWLREPTVTHGWNVANTNRSLGDVLAVIVVSPFFVEHGTGVGRLKAELAGRGRGLRVHLDDEDIFVEVVDANGTGARVLELSRRRSRVAKAVKVLRRAWARALHDRRPATHQDMSEAFVRHMRRLSLQGSWWPNPSFSCWLWLAAVTEIDPAALDTLRGYATLRYLPHHVAAVGEEEWQTEIYTTREVPDNRRLFGRHAVPIR